MLNDEKRNDLLHQINGTVDDIRAAAERLGVLLLELDPELYQRSMSRIKSVLGEAPYGASEALGAGFGQLAPETRAIDDSAQGAPVAEAAWVTGPDAIPAPEGEWSWLRDARIVRVSSDMSELQRLCQLSEPLQLVLDGLFIGHRLEVGPRKHLVGGLLSLNQPIAAPGGLVVIEGSVLGQTGVPFFARMPPRATWSARIPPTI
jgi:hypothetical protein